LDDSVSYFEQKLGVTEKERLLLQLYVSESPNPAETVRLFSMVRYEEESYSFNYMLSRLCARHGFQLAPAALRPRIRGCYRQIAVENIRRLSMLIQLAGQLESRSIPVLVVKGGALRLGPLAKIPRQMGDVDLVVPKARFEEARQTALKFGFTVEYDVLHSADLFWEGRHCLDLHYTLFKQNIWEPESEPIWSRAETITKNGIHLLLPPLEEQFLHLLVNAFDNMISNDCRKGAVSWAADCFDLLRLHPELSLKRVAALAKEYGVRSELSIAAVLLNRLIPGHFQELLQADGSRFDQRLCSRLRRYDYYISVPYEEICTYPLLKRIFFRIGYTYSCNAGSFYLISKSFWTCLRHYPAFLKTYWEIDSFWSLPAKMKKKMSEREKRKSCEGTTE
jgi:hypothetical protein